MNTKACTVWRLGAHLGCRAEGMFYISLYRLEDFYVEVYYHTCYDGIAAIKTFTCEEQLQPYLEQIDLKDIFPI